MERIGIGKRWTILFCGWILISSARAEALVAHVTTADGISKVVFDVMPQYPIDGVGFAIKAPGLNDFFYGMTRPQKEPIFPYQFLADEVREMAPQISRKGVVLATVGPHLLLLPLDEAAYLKPHSKAAIIPTGYTGYRDDGKLIQINELTNKLKKAATAGQILPAWNGLAQFFDKESARNSGTTTSGPRSPNPAPFMLDKIYFQKALRHEKLLQASWKFGDIIKAWDAPSPQIIPVEEIKTNPAAAAAEQARRQQDQAWGQIRQNQMRMMGAVMNFSFAREVLQQIPRVIAHLLQNDKRMPPMIQKIEIPMTDDSFPAILDTDPFLIKFHKALRKAAANSSNYYWLDSLVTVKAGDSHQETHLGLVPREASKVFASMAADVVGEMFP